MNEYIAPDLDIYTPQLPESDFKFRHRIFRAARLARVSAVGICQIGIAKGIELDAYARVLDVSPRK